MAGVVTTENGDEDRLAHQFDSQVRTGDVVAVQDSDSPLPQSSLSFSDMGLSVHVLEGLRRAGFHRPSPVQLKAIPLGRMGMDLIVQAKSGTGKTVVFSVVVLEAIDVKRPDVQAIVLSPTREIALQSTTVIRQLGHFINDLKVQLFVGGLPLADDIKNLAKCQVAVGTPGRLKYLIDAGHLNCSKTRLLVLDEADLLFSGGATATATDTELLTGRNTFPAAINHIWWSLPETKQVMALSATYTEHLVEQHLPRYLKSPVLVRVSLDDPSLLGVRQFFHKVNSKSNSPSSVFMAKVKELQRILKEIDFRQCLVFSNFHNSAEKLCETLRSSGWPVNYISSGLNQQDRFTAFHSLRAFQCKILVSTDLTARGVDAENVNLVVSLDVPWTRETYLHRVGRAGRFGSYGASVLLVSDTDNELDLLSRIQEPNASPIVRLPNPIPSDLANSEYQVDLSKLISVTRIVSNPPKKPSVPTPSVATRDTVNSSDTAGGCYRDDRNPERMRNPLMVKFTTSKKRLTTEAKTNSPVCFAENGNPTFSADIKKYVKLLNLRSKIQVEFTKDSKGPSAMHPVSLPNIDTTLEYTVTRQLAEFLNHPSSLPFSYGITHEEAGETADEEGEEEVDSTEHTPLTYEEPDMCYYHNPPEYCDLPRDQQPRTLTPRQQMLWDEYCRLVPWKDYFYQAWRNANAEYEEYLAEYNTITAQNPS